MSSKEQMDQLNKAIEEHLKKFPQAVSHPSVSSGKGSVPKVESKPTVEPEIAPEADEDNDEIL